LRCIFILVIKILNYHDIVLHYCVGYAIRIAIKFIYNIIICIIYMIFYTIRELTNLNSTPLKSVNSIMCYHHKFIICKLEKYNTVGLFVCLFFIIIIFFLSLSFIIMIQYNYFILWHCFLFVSTKTPPKNLIPTTDNYNMFYKRTVVLGTKNDNLL